MCKWGTNTKVNVIRRANPYVEDGWHKIFVDSCLADIIQELNDRGIITTQCCCMHGKGLPSIWVANEPESYIRLIDIGIRYGNVGEDQGDIRYEAYLEIAGKYNTLDTLRGFLEIN